jgi:hypothetical protein
MMHSHSDPVSLRMILITLIALLAFLPLALPRTHDRQPVRGYSMPSAAAHAR